MRIMVIRYGAWGDMVIITPLLRFLHQAGHEVFLHTSEIGIKVLAHSPHVTKFLPYESKSVPDHELENHWRKIAAENQIDKTINLCESLERAISLHPLDPMYNWPKQERRELCDVNFYEQTFRHAAKQHPTLFSEPPVSGSEDETLRPELFFTEEEVREMETYFKNLGNRRVVIWGLSGSSLNKSYPYTDYIIKEILNEFKDVLVITVGDELCQVLEVVKDKRIIRKSGKWSMRQSALACKYASLVVAPDTGLLHSAGCFMTPKIGIIGSNTINNISKTFSCDHSIEADSSAVPCAPCFRIIYSASTQCPTCPSTGLAICMTKGIHPQKVSDKIKEVLNVKRYEAGFTLSDLREAIGLSARPAVLVN